MDSKVLTLSADGLMIPGAHYTVSNGFLKKAQGPCHVRYSDLLSVELVRRRSKKAMYAVLLLACILMAILSVVRANISTTAAGTLKAASVENAQEAYQKAVELYELVQDDEVLAAKTEKAVKAAKAVMTVLIVLVALIGITGAIYLFSGRWMLELTTMRGTYRVPVKRGDPATKNLIAQLQSRIQGRR